MKFDIVIVGGGMIGLSCALSLAEGEFNICIIEKDYIPRVFNRSNIGRVSAINEATLLFFKRLDVWKSIQEMEAMTPYFSMKIDDDASAGQVTFTAEDACVDQLGHIVENKAIVVALRQKIEHIRTITFFQGQVSEVKPVADGGHELTLVSGERVSTQLIIGADGANSWIRHKFGFNYYEKSCRHKAIIATVETENPHQNSAYQRFNRQGILAFLPLPSSNLCSIVWSLDSAVADQVVALSREDFDQKLTDDFKHGLGMVRCVTPLQSYALFSRHVKQYYQSGVVLIGDAVHTIHPLAGQGVNLGFADVVMLSQQLLRAKQKHRQFFDDSVLCRYEINRRHDNQRMLWLMQGLQFIFEQQNGLSLKIRSIGMNVINQIPLIKRFLIQQARGRV